MAKSPSYEELQRENQELNRRIAILEQGQKKVPGQPVLQDHSLVYSLIQSFPLSVYAKDTSGRFIFVNRCYCERVAKSAQEVLGRTDFDLHPPELASKYVSDDQEIMSTRETAFFEEDWLPIGGEACYVNSIKSVLYDFDKTDSEQELSGTLGIFWDISKPKKTVAGLLQSEERYLGILENIKEGYFELDRSCKLSFCNDFFCKIIGRGLPELTGIDLVGLAAPDNRGAARTFLNRVLDHDSELESANFVFLSAIDHRITLNLSISPTKDSNDRTVGIRGVARDITAVLEAEDQRNQLARQLAQAQKLESIGTLAGGIAHDFNNILFIIQGYTDLALSDLKKQRDPSQKLEKLKGSCTRATDLIEQMLSFARHSEKERIPIDIRPIIKESIKLLRSALPATITIVQNIASSDESYVSSDPTEIHQVVMNLCTNAAQSMEGRNGTLSVALKDHTINEDSAGYGLKKGRHILLVIRDTGRGIPQAVISRIFEPFFTTKKIGEGTGLGLSVVHGLITGMDGVIRVESPAGEGTTFQIFLPVTERVMAHAVDEPKVVPKGSGEHILLVEDDPMLLSMMASMLKELNYSCTPCANGSDAFERFKAAPQNYDILLTDQTMPGMTGDALSRAVRAIRPDIPIILSTGFREQMPSKQAADLDVSAFLSKPIRIESLGKAIFDLLCLPAP